MKTTNLLQQKIQSLEKSLKKKQELLKKYKKSLSDSNVRIKNITKDLKASLNLLRDIHKNLIPVRLPQIPGFEFSSKFQPTKQGVSGDFFDVIPLEDSMKFGILLSSCNTYAVSSLFLSSFLKSSSHLKSHKTAKDFVSFVAKKISATLSQKEEIHLFYGIISRSSLEMDYCLAGDIFVGHKKGEEDFYTLPPSSPYLDVTKKPRVKSGKVTLNPKDVLLICSPGLMDRKNKKGQSFGKERIIQAAGKNKGGVLEVRQNVLFNCNEFGKDEVSLKDCSVLVIRARDRVLRVQPS